MSVRSLFTGSLRYFFYGHVTYDPFLHKITTFIVVGLEVPSGKGALLILYWNSVKGTKAIAVG